MRSSYLDYAMSVIVGRALPDVRDGLKPVHRRVLFSMNENGLQPNRPYSKSARIVGDVMGKYHPHGDSAIYDTLVAWRRTSRCATRSSTARATSARSTTTRPRPCGTRRRAWRRSRARCCATSTPTRSTSSPTTTAQNSEPVVLPARFPNLLVNGSSGIAVGMATNIPPHNLRETIAATIAYIDDPDIDTAGPDAAHQGPGLPDRRRDPRPVAASARPTRPAAAASACAPRRTSSSASRARRRSSSPSCPSWSRRAATAA